MQYKVLLYYFFANVPDPELVRAEHHAFSENLKIKGRVFIAHEGINGTVSGTIEAMEKYKEFLRSTLKFQGIQFKEDEIDYIPFAKLKTKVRKSLVAMGEADGIDVPKYTGKHLSPKEWRETLEAGDEYVLLDIRNNYESQIGRFKGAICPDLRNFHEFPKLAAELEAYKEKKILMYCTGGIRCEKFSALLVKEGFKDVNQLDGGIINYAKEEGGKHFEGSCFVFDDRLVVPINRENPVSYCKFCNTPEDRILNCADMNCNILFICCDACAIKHEGACREICKISPRKRPFNLEAFRIPYRKKGVVFPELGLTPRKAKTTA